MMPASPSSTLSEIVSGIKKVPIVWNKAYLRSFKAKFEVLISIPTISKSSLFRTVW